MRISFFILTLMFVSPLITTDLGNSGTLTDFPQYYELAIGDQLLYNTTRLKEDYYVSTFIPVVESESVNSSRYEATRQWYEEGRDGFVVDEITGLNSLKTNRTETSQELYNSEEQLYFRYNYDGLYWMLDNNLTQVDFDPNAYYSNHESFYSSKVAILNFDRFDAFDDAVLGDRTERYYLINSVPYSLYTDHYVSTSISTSSSIETRFSVEVNITTLTTETVHYYVEWDTGMLLETIKIWSVHKYCSYDGYIPNYDQIVAFTQNSTYTDTMHYTLHRTNIMYSPVENASLPAMINVTKTTPLDDYAVIYRINFTLYELTYNMTLSTYIRGELFNIDYLDNGDHWIDIPVSAIPYWGYNKVHRVTFVLQDLIDSTHVTKWSHNVLDLRENGTLPWTSWIEGPSFIEVDDMQPINVSYSVFSEHNWEVNVYENIGGMPEYLEVFEGSKNGTFSFTHSAKPTGQYSYTLTFSDDFGYIVDYHLTVKVLTYLIPTISGPDEKIFYTLYETYWLNYTFHSLECDENYYNINIKNSATTVIAEGSYTSNVSKIVSFNLYDYITSEGDYTLNITSWNCRGNVNWLLVITAEEDDTDTMPPDITGPSGSHTHTYGSTITFEWEIYDFNLYNATFTINGVLTETFSIVDNPGYTSITFSFYVQDHPVGQYTIVIEAWDTFDNKAVRTVTINIISDNGDDDDDDNDDDTNGDSDTNGDDEFTTTLNASKFFYSFIILLSLGLVLNVTNKRY